MSKEAQGIERNTRMIYKLGYKQTFWTGDETVNSKNLSKHTANVQRENVPNDGSSYCKITRTEIRADKRNRQQIRRRQRKLVSNSLSIFRRRLKHFSAFCSTSTQSVFCS